MREQPRETKTTHFQMSNDYEAEELESQDFRYTGFLKLFSLFFRVKGQKEKIKTAQLELLHEGVLLGHQKFAEWCPFGAFQFRDFSIR